MQFIPYQSANLQEKEMISRSEAFYELTKKRRSLRFFSDKPVPKEVIENVILAAGTAPSGANNQPWSFCVVSNPEIKATIRKAAEEEEYTNYHGRMSERWIEKLEPFKTNWHKPFLETAPYLIVVFRRIFEMIDGEKQNNYYVNESVGLATGILLSAINNAGLVSLTHTPSPLNFLAKILNRPENEKPYLLIPVGFPTEDAVVPDLKKKSLEEIAFFYE